MPGSVLEILVKAGDKVKKGQALMVTEAMKMETEVRAPRSGTVGSVTATEGAAVKVGDTLYTLG